MRFGLIGDHPDGLQMTRALVESGRHQLAAFAGPVSGLHCLGNMSGNLQPINDFEEILADPQIEAVIVASAPKLRPDHLRRALQSERHVLCVHPSDATPDMAYEASMLQRDTGKVLMPLLIECLHPGILKLRQLAGTSGGMRLLEVERRWSPGMPAPGKKASKLSFPGWDALRRCGGEVGEVFGLTSTETVNIDEPLVISGRFEAGGLFRITLLPAEAVGQLNYRLVAATGQARLLFSAGVQGPAHLQAGPAEQEITWEFSPWPTLVQVFEASLKGATVSPSLTSAESSRTTRGLQAQQFETSDGQTSTAERKWPVWEDEIRALELDDAVRRSIERHRASELDYQEASEATTFKGTMTLVGCGMLWGLLLLAILSRWYPWLGWLVLPMLAIFLAMQVLLWLVPASKRK
jgi:hypothetical protein